MSEDFKILNDREHALHRPGVYIGSTVEEPISGIVNYTYQTKNIVPGLLKCIEEIMQNSVDEFIRTGGEFATNISLNIANSINGTEITIADNGRGIPVVPVGDSYRPVMAWTALRAGSNFNDADGRVTAGTNGMGSALVNIFSKSFVGIADDGTKRCTVTCEDNMSVVDYKITKSSKRGTTVTFIPDLSRFGLINFTGDHVDIVRDRIANLSIMYPAITFTFNGEKFKYKNIRQIAKNFHEDAVSYEQDRISMVFAPAGSDEEYRLLSYVNGIYVKNGGSHVDYVMDKVVSAVREYVNKKHKINVLPNQIKQHLLFASWIDGFVNLKFDSQTKERITNTQGEVGAILGGIDFDKIARQILNTPAIIDPMIAAILYKKEMAEKLALAKANKDLDKSNLRKITKFTDASNKTDRNNCMLLICEGDSANSSVLSARTEMIGCYPLRGKPLNAMGADNKTVIANKELMELMTVLGLKIGQRVNSFDELRFGRIVLTTDSDLDGHVITGLMIAFFKKYWPELIEMGAVYRFETPIMKVEIGKEVLFFNTLEEFKAWSATNTKKAVFRYLKGLGSSSAKDFKLYFQNMDKHLVQITMNDNSDLDIVDLVFGKGAGATDKRKVWLDLSV